MKAEAPILSIPVAFIIFNRPETTAHVFEAIREAKPRQLLIIADGPRYRPPRRRSQMCSRTVHHQPGRLACEVVLNYAEANMDTNVASPRGWIGYQPWWTRRLSLRMTACLTQRSSGSAKSCSNTIATTRELAASPETTSCPVIGARIIVTVSHATPYAGAGRRGAALGAAMMRQ